MKAIMTALAGMGILGVILMLAMWLGLLVSTVYGLYLAFSASILLGIIVLVIEPSPLIIGLVMLLFHKNLAQMLLDFLTK